MATALNQLLFRGTRRVRLFFTGNLAAAAFTSTSYYAIVNVDGNGASPIAVLAVFAVTGNLNAVELAIDSDLASGALYEADCTGVPCADTTFFTGSLQGRVALELKSPPNVEPAQDDLDLLIYSRDIAHDGTDFLQLPGGDLDTTSGRKNWSDAMLRRFTSYGLGWNPNYGPKPDQYVDAPQPYAIPFSGSLLAQARLDDRTKQASVDTMQDPNDPSDWFFKVKLVGQDSLDPLTVNVPKPQNAT